MRGSVATILSAMLAAMVPAGAIAMTGPNHAQHRCRVMAGEKLPPSSGGAQAICAAIEQAVAAQAPKARFTAEVRVITPSMLATTLVVNGRDLPEQKFAVTDKDLNESSIKRFANSIAAKVADAARP